MFVRDPPEKGREFTHVSLRSLSTVVTISALSSGNHEPRERSRQEAAAARGDGGSGVAGWGRLPDAFATGSVLAGGRHKRRFEGAERAGCPAQPFVHEGHTARASRPRRRAAHGRG